MGLFYNRPLAVSCLSLVGAAFLCYFLNTTACLWLSLGLFLGAGIAVIISFVCKRKIVFLLGLCLILSCLAALSSALLFHARCEMHESLIDSDVEIAGTVLSVRKTQYGGEELEVALYRLGGDACYDTVRLCCPTPTGLSVGNALRTSAMCEAFYASEDYDARSAALADGVFGVMRVSDVEHIERATDAPISLRATMLSWREVLKERLSALIGGEEGALCVAFLLGDKTLLSSDSVLHFRRVGVSHLLALSGLHVSILIAFLEFFLKKLTCPRAARAVTVILLSLAYLLLTGCSLSTVRAVLMCCTLMLSFLFRGSYDSFTSLCTALATILIFTPWAIGDLGMWMSFLAAGAIIIFTPVIQSTKETVRERLSGTKVLSRVGTWLVSSLMVGVVANLALSPIQGFLFGELPLLSIPATILLSYPLTAVLILSMLCLFFPPLAFLCRAVAAMILHCTEFFSSMEGILLPINDAASLILLCLLSLLLVLCVTLKLASPMRWIMISVALWALLIPCSYLVTAVGFDRTEISYVSAENRSGEALVISRAGRCTVVNLSTESSYSPYAITEGVRAVRGTQIDDLVFTCYSKADGEMLSRFSGTVLVRRLHLPMPQNAWEEALAAEICTEAQSHGTEVLFRENTSDIPMLNDVTLLQMRPSKTARQPILFSFVHKGLRVTYANAAFGELHGGTLPYSDVLEETEIMIYGGNAKRHGKLSADFPQLHTLILKSPLHKDAFSEQVLLRTAISELPSYKLD